MKLAKIVGKEEVSSIELLRWFRERSSKYNCLFCRSNFGKIVWYIDTRPGDDIKISDKNNCSVFIVCCNCGKENPLSELLK
ncbi:MAG: hypothetical protein NZ895_01200 [Archaeoglobaceae archaeon]|nr:hypothetical protein [Archaeoglobaceae archaeon]MCX8151699.1 hypothetical protein [Archaeoglobaceae archaeon]MDW8013023.1 hypothetical protein [Archaeoglobaceae archaeon]